jgi:hypothetical protein
VTPTKADTPTTTDERDIRVKVRAWIEPCYSDGTRKAELKRMLTVLQAEA